jgi:hypothetical protein
MSLKERGECYHVNICHPRFGTEEVYQRVLLRQTSNKYGSFSFLDPMEHIQYKTQDFV